VVKLLPETQARRFRAIVMEVKGNTALVGMADPTDLFAYDEISRLLKREISLAVVNEGQLMEAIDRLYRRTEELTDLAHALEEELGDTAVDFGLLSAGTTLEDAPVVRLLQTMFEDAAQVRASDIHIEPQEKVLRIRFRIDGVLHLQTEVDAKIAPALALRLKLMSGLDISEKRLPQDGRFHVRVKNRTVDVRISTLPTQYGESVVMRLLNQEEGIPSLESLGFPPAMLARFRQIFHRSRAWCWSPAPPVPARRPRFIRYWPSSTRWSARSSPSRTRWNTACPASTRSRSTRKSTSPSPACCVPCCARTRTSCWWGRCVTRKPPRSACAPP
jgi:MSHA biogenesis protein MshE